MLVYKNKDNTLSLATRGDGTYGSNITHLLPYIKLPSHENISTNVIRGELIMKKDIFNTYYAKDNKNARNFVSGLINSKTIDKQGLERCDFIAYNCPEEKLCPSDIFQFLKKQGFNIPTTGVIKKSDCNIDNLSNILLETKLKSKYEMDGIVIADNVYHLETIGKCPEYTIAFKKNAEGVETKVIDVLWEESRYGLLKPRVQLEPTDIGGVCITFASGKNARFDSQSTLD
jgi:DNA ligase (NAD+)